MARRFWRRRGVLLAAIIVALSVGIVVAGVPYIPHPPGTLQQAQSRYIRGGSIDSPSTYAITLPNIPGGARFAVGVTVTNGIAGFCVERQSYYITWEINNNTRGGIPFQYDNCILNTQSSQTTLRFTPTITDSWDVVAVNTNPSSILIEFSPAA